MKAKYKRLYFISLLMGSFFIGCGILFFNLKDNLVYFYSPTEVLKKIVADEKIRLGGLVEENSIERKLILLEGKRIEEINFKITDLESTIKVNYYGILPDLFKEGQGVIVEGYLKENKKTFIASQVLAKHDENYMPPEVKSILERE